MSASSLPTIDQLLSQIIELQTIIVQQSERIAFLESEIASLKGQKTGGSSPRVAPDWAKANVKKAEPVEAKVRKQREESFVRLREEPTEEVVHACTECPDCGRTLAGGSVRSRRQVLELPEITVRVIEHLFLERYCGVCQKRCAPQVDLSEQAVGQSRFGPRVHSLVAYLRQVCRLPVSAIASLLSAFCRLKVSEGEVVALLATVAKLGESAYEALRTRLTESSYVHGDETGWRETGQNGYLWSFSTPDTCYFVYPKTRAGHVVTDVLGEGYQGIVVSDFYGGYNAHFGLHQRCWVHLLRDVHTLRERFPTQGVLEWCQKLRYLYDRAKAFSSAVPKERVMARLGFQRELNALSSPYPKANLPQSVLCKRLLQFEGEMFTFVEHPQVPSENNFAERTIRPRVIARKISGGTRSEAGSQTMTVLSSLFATWKLRGEETLTACQNMMQNALKSSLPHPA